MIVMIMINMKEFYPMKSHSSFSISMNSSNAQQVLNANSNDNHHTVKHKRLNPKPNNNNNDSGNVFDGELHSFMRQLQSYIKISNPVSRNNVIALLTHYV